MALAVSAYIIPLGFRAVFAFLNTPAGLSFEAVDGEKPYLDLAAALSNPTFLPLYLKSIVGALTTGLLAVGGEYACRHLKGQGSDATLRVVKSTVVWSSLGLLAMFALGFWYTMSLMGVEYKFNNIFGGLGWHVGDGVVRLDYSWLFLVKMALVGIQGLMLVYLVHGLAFSDRFPEARHLKALVVAGVSGLATIVAGEYLNAFSQYPYFIADVTDPKVVAGIPQPWRSIIAELSNMEASNPLASGTGLMIFTLGFLGILVVAAGFLLYLLLSPGAEDGE